MKPEKSPPMEMGKRGRLVITLGFTTSALVWGVLMLQAMQTEANVPSWPVYALMTLGNALCAVCWLISWLRYDKNHSIESNQDI